MPETHDPLTEAELVRLWGLHENPSPHWLVSHLVCHDVLRLVAEVRRLRADVARAQDTIRSFADRCAGQSEALTARALKMPEDMRHG